MSEHHIQVSNIAFKPDGTWEYVGGVLDGFRVVEVFLDPMRTASGYSEAFPQWIKLVLAKGEEEEGKVLLQLSLSLNLAIVLARSVPLIEGAVREVLGRQE